MSRSIDIAQSPRDRLGREALIFVEMNLSGVA